MNYKEHVHVDIAASVAGCNNFDRHILLAVNPLFFIIFMFGVNEANKQTNMLPPLTLTLYIRFTSGSGYQYMSLDIFATLSPELLDVNIS